MALNRTTDRGIYIESALEDLLQKHPLSAPDRRLCRELAFGCVRWRATLDWLIARKVTRAAPKPRLAEILRMGLYQLLWLERIPPHAIVNEAVVLARKHGFERQKGFVNAMLRGYAREREATLKELAELRKTDPARGWSHPGWLTDRWTEEFGAEDCAALLEWNNRPAPTFARLNGLMASVAELERRWDEEGVEHEAVTTDPAGGFRFFRIRAADALDRLPSFRDGWFYLQDPGTAIAPELLAARPGERVLDFCAAPGGKSAMLAEAMENLGELFLHDKEPRLDLVKENCQRLGVTCVASFAEEGRLPVLPENERFDRVLVDAPCSNTGVMRRRVDLRWRISEQEIDRLGKLQSRILSRAAEHVRLGGRLVYSTCSIEEVENAGQVKAFLTANPTFKLVAERTLVPFRDGVDGAYSAALERIS